ncbi:MAG: hypothetical protein QOE91_1562, partial [Gaiellaceae bacterium]|nr:hypothetical protein [Gaiellaceae bacterium]
MIPPIRLLMLGASVAVAMIGIAALTSGLLAYFLGATVLAVILVIGAPLALV